ncbi:hypothetical protein VP01_2095g3, partial [Puccinia sorghi]
MPKKASPKPTKPTTKKTAIQRKSKKNRGKNSSEYDYADKKAGHLKKEDNLGRLLLLVVQQKVKLMAINLHNQSPSNIKLKIHQMKYQFNTYKDKYKKIHTKSISTGFGLTNEDQKAGI